jgi:hypothetical protein
MKKLFAILAVAGFMAACNNGENKDAAKDSAAADTSATMMDTSNHMMDTANHTMDSTTMGADTTKH